MTKIVFAPGCFDDFVGTQEELDEMVADITQQLLDELDGEDCTLIEVDAVEEISRQPRQ
jgi:hypothetical protein